MQEQLRLSRVLLGGLGAGLVLIFLWLLPGLTLAHIFRALPQSEAMTFISATVVLIFLLSILMTWLYAAVSGRFKAGAMTAALVGAALAVLIDVMQYLGWLVLLHRVPLRPWLITALVTLVIFPAAAMVGAWIYGRPSTQP